MSQIVDRKLVHRALYAKAFDFLFVAYLLIIILPDMAGCILLVIGARRLYSLHTDAVRISDLAILQIFLWVVYIIAIVVIYMYHWDWVISKQQNIEYILWGMILAQIPFAILEIIVGWKLCGIVRDLADHVHDKVLSGNAALFRKCFFGLYIAYLFLVTIGFLYKPIDALGYLAYLLLMAANILVMLLSQRAKKICLDNTILKLQEPDKNYNNGAQG